MNKVSIIVPSMNEHYLRYLLSALSRQSIKPFEIIIVIKGFNAKHVEDTCKNKGLRCNIIEQKQGYVTHALNLGKKEAKGDMIVFTDDDAIPPGGWIKRYVKLYSIYPNTSCISSRDIYLELNFMRLMPTPDDLVNVRLYRWLIRPWLERPHPALNKYRLGVYLTKDLKIAHGLCIPNGTCYSLPFRGVNMSFSGPALSETKFPEHPLLKRAPMYEQYAGLQLVLKGHNCIYTSNNPILHIARVESLSRGVNDKKALVEIMIMRNLFAELLKQHGS